MQKIVRILPLNDNPIHCYHIRMNMIKLTMVKLTRIVIIANSIIQG